MGRHFFSMSKQSYSSLCFCFQGEAIFITTHYHLQGGIGWEWKFKKESGHFRINSHYHGNGQWYFSQIYTQIHSHYHHLWPTTKRAVNDNHILPLLIRNSKAGGLNWSSNLVPGFFFFFLDESTCLDDFLFAIFHVISSLAILKIYLMWLLLGRENLILAKKN